MHPRTENFLTDITRHAHLYFFLGTDGKPKILVSMNKQDFNDSDDLKVKIVTGYYSDTLPTRKLAPRIFLVDDTEPSTFPANIEFNSSSGRRFQAMTISNRLKNRVAFYNTALVR